MKRKFQFWDVDGTLLSTRVWLNFERFLIRQCSSGIGRSLIENQLEFAVDHLYPRLPREVVNRCFYLRYRGRSTKFVENQAKKWFNELLRNSRSVFVESAVEQLEQLRKHGIDPVFVSGSASQILRPLAAHLGVNHILSTSLESEGGLFSGRLVGAPMIGIAKKIAVEKFALDHDSELADCIAVGDDATDIPMLKCVGNALVVSGNNQLERIAWNRNWPILRK